MVTQDWISERIKKTIDQHFQESRWIKNKKYLKTSRLYFIGGVLQTALHLLPTDKYYEIKRWCYETHGYDPGGQADERPTLDEGLYKWFKKLIDNPKQLYKDKEVYTQMTIEEWMEENNADNT